MSGGWASHRKVRSFGLFGSHARNAAASAVTGKGLTISPDLLARNNPNAPGQCQKPASLINNGWTTGFLGDCFYRPFKYIIFRLNRKGNILGRLFASSNV
jgi:hypothetical protein